MQLHFTVFFVCIGFASSIQVHWGYTFHDASQTNRADELGPSATSLPFPAIKFASRMELNRAFPSSPLITSSGIFVTDSYGQLVALSPDLYEHSTDIFCVGCANILIALDDGSFVGSHKGNVTAFSSGGGIRWQKTTYVPFQYDIESVVTPDKTMVISPMILQNYTDSDPYISYIGFNYINGQALWNEYLHFASTPVLSQDGTIVALSAGSNCSFYQIAGEEVELVSNYNGISNFDVLTFTDEGYAILALAIEQVVAVDPVNGDIKWTYNFTSGNNGTTSMTANSWALSHDGCFYALLTGLDATTPEISHTELIALNASNGEQLWTADMLTPPCAHLAVDGNDVLYLSITEGLYAMDHLVGDELWSNQHFVSGTCGPISFFNNSIYVATPSGVVLIQGPPMNFLVLNEVQPTETTLELIGEFWMVYFPEEFQCLFEGDGIAEGTLAIGSMYSNSVVVCALPEFKGHVDQMHVTVQIRGSMGTISSNSMPVVLKHKGISGGTKAGIVLGVLAIVVIAAIIGVFVWKGGYKKFSFPKIKRLSYEPIL